MPGQFLLRLGALALGVLTPAPLPIRVPVSAVAADETHALALTGEEVRLMDGAGLPLGRLRGPAVPAAVAARRGHSSDAGFAAAGVLDDADFNDPHDPDSEIEDAENILVEDDPPVHRRARRAPAASAVVFAVGQASAWVGRGDGLWRVTFEGDAERVPLAAAGPVRQLASGADGRVIVAVAGGGIFRSDAAGAPFHRLPEGPQGVSRLAVTGLGVAYALVDERLLRLEQGAPAVEVIGGGVEDVAACGSGALALVQRRLIWLPGPGTARQGERGASGDVEPQGQVAPAGAERLACSPDGSLWIAYGAALWVSADRGRTWTVRDDTGSTFPIAAVTATRVALWVAGAAGLAVLPLRPPSPPRAQATAAPSATALRLASLPDVAPRGRDRAAAPSWRWWLSALPRVDLAFATARSSARREVRAFLLLSFSLDPRRDTRAGRQLDIAAAAAERRAAAQETLARGVSGDPTADPIAEEERDATSRLLD